MLAAAAASANLASTSHPAVAVLLGLGAVVVAVVTVAMAWSVHARQIQLAETLARRQYGFATAPAGGQPDTAPADRNDDGADGANGATGPAGPAGPPGAAAKTPSATATVPPVVIDGPDTLITGDQGRYRVRRGGNRQVMSWAVGGGAVSQAPDPAHPDELLLVADQPGSLTITVRVRDGLTERRATKTVTAQPEPPAPAPPVMLRIFLHGWTLVVVAVLLIGFAAALSALGNLSSAEFIALVSPLAALLGVVAAVRGLGDPDKSPGTGRPTRSPRSGG
ncbi:MAG TPA: hypothetical protein VID31_17755 [Streptosporangiaceae bacterium]